MSASIIDILSGFRAGRFLTLLNDRLEELQAACGELKMKGSISIEIELKPTDRDGQFALTSKIKMKKPIATAPSAIVYIDDAGDMERFDPKQPAMFGEDQMGKPTNL
jgi:hypothetical protein